jgi:hypothetical protein
MDVAMGLVYAKSDGWRRRGVRKNADVPDAHQVAYTLVGSSERQWPKVTMTEFRQQLGGSVLTI